MKSIGMRARRTWQILTRQAAITTVVANEVPRTTAQIIISVILVVAGIYIIGWHGNPALADLAKGWIGAVIGYWLS